MSREPEAEADRLTRRYGPTAGREWQSVIAHLDFAESFALIVLIVPDADGAAICRNLLARILKQRNRWIDLHEATEPKDLVESAGELLSPSPVEERGLIWLAGVVPQSVADYPDWATAWETTLEVLNQARNPLIRELGCPLMIVAAPWLVPLFREVAPDLWSVRRLVAHMEPDAEVMRARGGDQPLPQSDARASRPGSVGPDPDFALAEAERIEGIAGREAERALLLFRAGRGFLARGEAEPAEAVLLDAIRLLNGLHDLIREGIATDELGRALLDQGRAGEAEAAFRRSLALKEEGGDTATSRGITMGQLGRALLDQGRAAEGEAAFRRSLELLEQGGATATSRGITTHELGLALRDQGRAAEAEDAFRRSLQLAEEGGDIATSRGITIHELGRALLDQGRPAEAEAAFRRSLQLAEEGGDTATSRGITTHGLGRALRDQGRAAEAEDAFRRSLQLAEEGGDTATSRGITTHELGRALLDQGRAAEAEAAFRRSLALKEEGGATATSRGITTHELGRALLDQGRTAEAEAAFRLSLALAEEGGDTAASRSITIESLSRALRAQGRDEEADAAFRLSQTLNDSDA